MSLLKGWGCSSVGTASDRQVGDAGSIPRCGKGFFSYSQLSVQTLLRCPYTPVRNRMHLHMFARLRSRSPCQSSVDCGNTKTPSMYRRLGSATLSQLVFFWGKQPEIPMGETPPGQNSCKSKLIYGLTVDWLLGPTCQFVVYKICSRCHYGVQHSALDSKKRSCTRRRSLAVCQFRSFQPCPTLPACVES